MAGGMLFKNNLASSVFFNTAGVGCEFSMTLILKKFVVESFVHKYISLTKIPYGGKTIA